MVVKILTTSAWLRSWVFKHTHGERGGKKLGFGVVQCVCAFGTRSPQWCCVGGLRSGEVREKWVVPEVLELGLQTREEGGKLSAQIACCNSGFLDVCNEDPYFWSCVVELFKWKRNAQVYFIYFAVSFLKISLDFSHLSALLPAYKSPSIVFSLHPVFFGFFWSLSARLTKSGIVRFDTLSSLSFLLCPVFLLGHKLWWKEEAWREREGRKEGEGKMYTDIWKRK